MLTKIFMTAFWNINIERILRNFDSRESCKAVEKIVNPSAVTFLARQRRASFNDDDQIFSPLLKSQSKVNMSRTSNGETIQSFPTETSSLRVPDRSDLFSLKMRARVIRVYPIPLLRLIVVLVPLEILRPEISLGKSYH